MLQCYPYGVGQGDEGVCLLLHIGGYRVLLDCGLQDITPLIDQPQPPADFVFCSHAHADHARSLLQLHQAFPQLPVYVSELTAPLLPLNWLGEAVPWFWQSLPWRTQIEVEPGLTVQLFPAGHLPGAAAIALTGQTEAGRTERVLYTGDYQLTNAKLVDGLKIEDLRGLSPQVLILEAGYGTARFPQRRRQENQLIERLDRAIASGQSVLLPLSKLGLAQEILILLRTHSLFSGRDVTLWVHGDIGAACDVYEELLPCFPVNIQNFAQYQSLFWDIRVRPYLRRLSSVDRLRSILEQPTLSVKAVPEKACIVLTDAIAQLQEFCQIGGDWLLLLPQHQDLRLDWLTEAQREKPEEKADRQWMRSTAVQRVTVETYTLAEHGDQASTTQLIHNLQPQHLVFVHGAAAEIAELAALNELSDRYKVHAPITGHWLELPIGEAFIQPERPAVTYEGEVAELAGMVSISLPDTIITDPRWSRLGETGLIEARWQGEELVLRGISQREWLGQQQLQGARCGNCRYYHLSADRARAAKFGAAKLSDAKVGICRNTRSPLYQFQVANDSYCPVFESRD
ncbi:MAG: MBL fold metallo-hydrolase [Synechococcales bacterium]|nr:MBL fold metallo-hydrolase [Synechococcales bacterium]